MKKVCRCCKKKKAISKFWMNRASKDKLDIYCIECGRNKNKKITEKNRATDWSGLDKNIQKKCSACKKVFKLDEFFNNKSNTLGKSSRCKKCDLNSNRRTYFLKRDYRLAYMKSNYQKKKHIISDQNKQKRKSDPDFFKNIKLKDTFGITIEQYKSILDKQKNVCAICKGPETDFDKRIKKVRSLAVDHCHNAHKVRGLLCRSCNHGLGNFKDSVIFMSNAIKYLKKHGGFNVSEPPI